MCIVRLSANSSMLFSHTVLRSQYRALGQGRVSPHLPGAGVVFGETAGNLEGVALLKQKAGSA